MTKDELIAHFECIALDVDRLIIEHIIIQRS
jgi:hypothetical protein